MSSVQMARKSILPRSRTSRVGQRREYLHRRCRGTYIWNGVSVRSSISFDGGRSLNAVSRALYRVVWPWAQKISTDGKYSLWQTYTASGNLQHLEVWIRELDGRATKRERNQCALPSTGHRNNSRWKSPRSDPELPILRHRLEKGAISTLNITLQSHHYLILTVMEPKSVCASIRETSSLSNALVGTLFDRCCCINTRIKGGPGRALDSAPIVIDYPVWYVISGSNPREVWTPQRVLGVCSSQLRNSPLTSALEF